MEIHNFKVGDRVIVLDRDRIYKIRDEIIGWTGVIEEIKNWPRKPVLVRFAREYNPVQNGYWFDPHEIENERIHNFNKLLNTYYEQH